VVSRIKEDELVPLSVALDRTVPFAGQVEFDLHNLVGYLCERCGYGWREWQRLDIVWVCSSHAIRLGRVRNPCNRDQGSKISNLGGYNQLLPSISTGPGHAAQRAPMKTVQS
jgi:hypothetical protein